MNDQQSSQRKPWTKFQSERVHVSAPECVVWHLSGLFTDSKEAYAFLDEFRADLKTGGGPIVLDLAKVDHVTSCGVGILGACHCSATNAGRRICLAGLSERAAAVLSVVGLARVAEIHPNREAALKSLGDTPS